MNTVKVILTILNIPRLFPHIVFYLIFKNQLRKDIERNAINSLRLGRSFELLMLLVFHKQFRNLFYYRIGFWKYFCTFLLRPYETFTIGTNCSIGEGMIPGHSFSTIINAKSIGTNFTVFQNCTIGVSNGKRPIIGNNVTIFTNCVVVGGITIGDNVQIGGGSVVCKSIPNNCVVVGNPARIVRREGVKCNEKL